MSPKSLDEKSVSILLIRLGIYKKSHKWSWEETAKRINMQIRTVHRWRKTRRISKVYAKLVEKFLKSRAPELWFDSASGGERPDQI